MGFGDYWGEKKKKKGKNILLNPLFREGNTNSKLRFWLLIKSLAWHWEKAVLLQSIPLPPIPNNLLTSSEKLPPSCQKSSGSTDILTAPGKPRRIQVEHGSLLETLFNTQILGACGASPSSQLPPAPFVPPGTPQPWGGGCEQRWEQPRLGGLRGKDVRREKKKSA